MYGREERFRIIETKPAPWASYLTAHFFIGHRMILVALG